MQAGLQADEPIVGDDRPEVLHGFGSDVGRDTATLSERLTAQVGGEKTSRPRIAGAVGVDGLYLVRSDLDEVLAIEEQSAVGAASYGELPGLALHLLAGGLEVVGACPEFGLLLVAEQQVDAAA